MALKQAKPVLKSGGTQVKKTEAPENKRPVLFNEISVCGHVIPEDDLYASADDAKALLGWESESDHEARLTADVSPEVASKMNVKYGDEYDIKDYNGEKVRCNNNLRNRPIQMPWVDTIAQEILNNRWEFNGEAWIIGETGLTLSLQHRGHGLIRAQQILDYEGDDETKQERAKHWRKVWGEGHQLKIPALVVRGVKEAPSVTRTLDNVRPRSLSDVLFADTSLFHKTAKADREKLCRIMDYTIRTVWHRTGCSDDAFSPKRTHSESLEFLTAHPRLLKAVMHIWTELNRKNTEGEKPNIMQEYISAGTAAGLMFLMGACKSSREQWDGADSPNDRHLNFDMWDKAAEFWAKFGDPKDADLEPARKCIANCGNSETGAKASVPVKIAVIVNAWNEFIDENGHISVKNVMPEFGDLDDFGKRPLVSMPSVGGIDLGDPVALRKEREAQEAEEAAAEAAALKAAEGEGSEAEEDDEAATDTGPSAEELARIEAEKERQKAESLAKKKASNPAPAKKGLRGGVGSK